MGAVLVPREPRLLPGAWALTTALKSSMAKLQPADAACRPRYPTAAQMLPTRADTIEGLKVKPYEKATTVAELEKAQELKLCAL